MNDLMKVHYAGWDKGGPNYQIGEFWVRFCYFLGYFWPVYTSVLQIITYIHAASELMKAVNSLSFDRHTTFNQIVYETG